MARKFEARSSARDVKGVIALFADSAEIMVPGIPKGGKSQFDQYLQGFVQGFPDQTMRIVSMIESGDTAAGEIEYSGTNTGSMPSPMGGMMPPTGKRMMVPGAFVIKAKDGKIVSFHGYFDQAAMAQQLGMAQQPR